MNQNSIKVFDCSLSGTANNLALDEALVVEANNGNISACLRFWTPNEIAVILGKGLKIEKEVNINACRQDKIAVYKRCSGGGAVVLSPKTLCFSFVLFFDQNKVLRDLNKSYKYFCGIVSEAFFKLGLPLEFEPICDLVSNGRKVSGNAQARKRIAVLHHGTLIIDEFSNLMSKYLAHPSKEPNYRNNRPHDEFVISLKEAGCIAIPDEIKKAIVTASGFEYKYENVPAEILAKAKEFAGEKYENLIETIQV